MNRFAKIFYIFAFLLFGIHSKSQYKASNYACSSVACTFNLTYTGDGDYFKTPKSPIIKNLVFTFKALAFMDFTFKFVDPNKSRFQWPQGFFQNVNTFPQDPYANFSFPMQSASYEFSYNLDPFSFKIVRLSTNYTIFSTIGQQIVFSEHYLQIGTPIQRDFIYGLGERFVNSFKVRNGKWTIFNRDHPFEIDHGDGQQTYGHYPYYINRQKANFYHLAYFRNSNAMDVIKQQISGQSTLTFKTIGGIIDFRFILGDRDPIVLLTKWSNYPKRANLPPFWSLGFHQCRWGYENSSMLLDVLSNYQKNSIPLDTIWSDIDYMKDFEDFTIDEDRFPLSDMAKIKEKYRYIPIIDAGIKLNGSAYQQGLKRNVFVKDALGENFIGQVWPGKTAFVDFFHPQASQYWSDMLNVLYSKIKFDGVWLDMNELSNFCNGPCDIPSTKSVFDFTHDLPYHPGKDVIESSTIPLNCTHYSGLQQADVHDFHGYLQSLATFNFLKSKNVRPFIVSRSSTIGSSRYANHWTGDNAATWEFLQGSIPNIFNGHLNGFKMVGQDICGFAGQTTVQLCSRWYQLGALYPFSRSHNIIGEPSQEPYALGDVVLTTATKAIRLRYSLLKSLYTYMMKEKHSFIWAPLFFIYPNNDLLYADQIADTTFVLLESLLITPILEQGKTSRSVYFPENDWYDLFSGKRYLTNSTSTINCSLTDTVPIFLSEGYSVFLQDVDKVANTDQLSLLFRSYSALSLIREESGLEVYSAKNIINSFGNHSDEQNINICEIYEVCFYQVTIELYIQPGKRYLKIKSSTSSFETASIGIQYFNLYYQKGTIRFSTLQPAFLNRAQQTIPIPRQAYQSQEPDLEPNLRIQ